MDIMDNRLFKAYLYTSEILLRCLLPHLLLLTSRFLPIVTLATLNALIIYKFQRIAARRQRLKGYSLSSVPGKPSSRRASSPPSSPAASVNMTTATDLPSAPRPSICSQSGLLQPHAPSSPSRTRVSHAPLPPALVRNSTQRASTRRRSLQSPEERMLVLVLISIVVLFVCCTTPAAILSILYSVKYKDDLGFQVFRALANNLELLNFALNFYIYCLCSAEIRRAFVSLFQQCSAAMCPSKQNPGVVP